MPQFAEFAASIGLSELQLLLGLIGLLLLIIVMIYNAVRLRKTEQIEDVQLEPHLDKIQEPTFHEPTDEARALEIKPDHKIDSLIDCVVALRLPEAISGQEIQILSAPIQNFSASQAILEGLTESDRWEKINPTETYLELQLAVQMASRKGPIGVVELSDFFAKAQELAEQLDAEIDLPPVQQILDQAKELDQFASQVDVQLGVTVVPLSGRWQQSSVMQCFANLGLKKSNRHACYFKYEGEKKLFEVHSQDIDSSSDEVGISYITFIMDLPQVSSDSHVFQAILRDAQTMASQLGGTVVDDAGRPLLEEAIRAIADQLQSLYQLMHEHGIAAGTPTAQRLFS